ncbi:hypothetical protein M1555_02105 [Patescibacteria group bacterium]|nr:hypothetical protein [Patescibacteria group bacterium]
MPYVDPEMIGTYWYIHNWVMVHWKRDQLTAQTDGMPLWIPRPCGTSFFIG